MLSPVHNLLQNNPSFQQGIQNILTYTIPKEFERATDEAYDQIIRLLSAPAVSQQFKELEQEANKLREEEEIFFQSKMSARVMEVMDEICKKTEEGYTALINKHNIDPSKKEILLLNQIEIQLYQGSLFDILYSNKMNMRRDLNLFNKIEKYQEISIEELKLIPLKKQKKYLQEAREFLFNLNSFSAPQFKLNTLFNCISILCKWSNLLREEMGKNMSEEDTLISLIIFVVLKSNPPAFISNFQFISKFRHPKLLGPESNYYLLLFSSVISTIETFNFPDNFGKLPSHTEKLSASDEKYSKSFRKKSNPSVNKAKTPINPSKFLTATADDLSKEDVNDLLEQYRYLLVFYQNASGGNNSPESTAADIATNRSFFRRPTKSFRSRRDSLLSTPMKFVRNKDEDQTQTVQPAQPVENAEHSKLFIFPSKATRRQLKAPSRVIRVGWLLYKRKQTLTNSGSTWKQIWGVILELPEKSSCLRVLDDPCAFDASFVIPFDSLEGIHLHPQSSNLPGYCFTLYSNNNESFTTFSVADDSSRNYWVKYIVQSCPSELPVMEKSQE